MGVKEKKILPCPQGASSSVRTRQNSESGLIEAYHRSQRGALYGPWARDRKGLQGDSGSP